MRKLLYVTLLSILFFSCSDDHSVFISDDGQTDSTDHKLTEEWEQMLKLVNDVRKTGCDCGGEWQDAVDPLSWDSTLAKIAYYHSLDMENNDYFSHIGQDGSSPGDRITEGGYSWWSYGENIAKGYTSVESVFQGWMNSSGHCKNIMSGNVTEMGVGKSGVLWTQVFAKPRD